MESGALLPFLEAGYQKRWLSEFSPAPRAWGGGEDACKAASRWEEDPRGRPVWTGVTVLAGGGWQADAEVYAGDGRHAAVRMHGQADFPFGAVHITTSAAGLPGGASSCYRVDEVDGPRPGALHTLGMHLRTLAMASVPVMSVIWQDSPPPEGILSAAGLREVVTSSYGEQWVEAAARLLRAE